MGVHLIAQFVSISELQAKDVFFIEAVTLQCVDDQGRLKAIFEVGKAQYHSFIR